jgi:hypothetical protein
VAAHLFLGFLLGSDCTQIAPNVGIGNGSVPKYPHVIFEPIDFLARLAALVPKPRVNLTRFHGVFAPNSKHRIHVTPAKRGRGRKKSVQQPWDEKTPVQRHVSMTWMQRLKRVFNIDIEICEKCKGPVKIIACVEDPAVIEKILKHLKEKVVTRNTVKLPPERAPPQIGLFDLS